MTQKQADDTYHIYRNVCIGYIPEIRYNSDRKRFEPKDVHISTELLEQALKEYHFFNTFAEDPEIPEHESTEDEEFLTPPESPQPETPRPPIKELSPEPSVKSTPQHRTLTPVKSALKVRFQQ